jgi:hypothetical protein
MMDDEKGKNSDKTSNASGALISQLASNIQRRARE